MYLSLLKSKNSCYVCYKICQKIVDDIFISELNVNAKGHVYGKGASYILPQAIVSATTPVNVPIGTLWYDIGTNS